MRDEAGQPGDTAGARRAAGELEAGVLAVLQAAGRPLPPGEVRERVGGGLAYTTVVTILSRLHDKGVLQRRKAGRAYLYAPVADEPGLAARRILIAAAEGRTPDAPGGLPSPGDAAAGRRRGRAAGRAAAPGGRYLAAGRQLCRAGRGQQRRAGPARADRPGPHPARRRRWGDVRAGHQAW